MYRKTRNNGIMERSKRRREMKRIKAVADKQNEGQTEHKVGKRKEKEKMSKIYKTKAEREDVDKRKKNEEMREDLRAGINRPGYRKRETTKRSRNAEKRK